METFIGENGNLYSEFSGIPYVNHLEKWLTQTFLF